jgi:hypothetical protein
LYSSANNIRVINSRRVIWVGYIACLGEKRNQCKSLAGKYEGRKHLQDLGIDAKIILK